MPRKMLQEFASEVVIVLDDARRRRNTIVQELETALEEKQDIRNNVTVLQAQLAIVEADLERKRKTWISYNTTLKQTKQAYEEIMNSSEVLVDVLTRKATDIRTTHPELPKHS